MVSPQQINVVDRYKFGIRDARKNGRRMVQKVTNTVNDKGS